MLSFFSGLRNLRDWFLDELDTPATQKLPIHPESHNVIQIRIELPVLLQREEAFRESLEKEHRKRWEKFVRQHWFRQNKMHTKQSMFRFFPLAFIGVGTIILANALWPIASYLVFTSPFLQQQQLVSPVPDNPVIRQSSVLAQAQNTVTTPEALRPKIIRDNLDYTNLSNWFPSGVAHAADEAVAQQRVEEYTLHIPTLGIENAVVKVGGTDLDNNLIQYPGTADPGDFGAPVIFGHSVLRQFYNPSEKNPRRYMSIFSKIMTMQSGEKIYIDYDGIRYTYSVVKKVEVKPEDMYILEQEYNARQLKLITCVPEGTYLRRGVVLAQLETMESTPLE